MRRSSSSISSGFEFDDHAQPRGRFVHQVDRLVRQEAIGDVAVGQGRRRDDRRVGDPHPVMQLIFLFDAAQNRDRVLDRRLADEDRLEAPRQRRILLDVLAVFVECGGADAVQFAARQGRLQHVGRVHRAFRLPGPDERVQLVDEEDDVARRRGDLRQHGLQTLLEFAAVFRAGDQRAEVERQQALVFQALRHIAVDDAQRQPFDDRGLADAGLADQHRVVLGAARQHLDRATNFLVATDDGVELALARHSGQVARILLQGFVAVLGRGAVGGAPLAHLLDRGVEALRGYAGGGERLTRRGGFVHRQGEQHTLDRDKAVACLLGDLLGLVKDAGQLRAHVNLAGAAALDLGLAVEFGLYRLQRSLGIAAGGIDQVGAKAFLVVEQDLEQMFRRQPLVSAAQRQILGGLDKSLGPLGIFLEFHELSPMNQPPRPPIRQVQRPFTEMIWERPPDHSSLGTHPATSLTEINDRRAL